MEYNNYIILDPNKNINPEIIFILEISPNYIIYTHTVAQNYEIFKLNTIVKKKIKSIKITKDGIFLFSLINNNCEIWLIMQQKSNKSKYIVVSSQDI